MLYLSAVAACFAASESSSLRSQGVLAAVPPPCFPLSNAFGNSMVLQRDQRAVIYGSVCGSAASATLISVSIDGGAAVTTTIAVGATSWSVTMPPHPASHAAHTVQVTSSGGTSALSMTLTDVLFGDVILCSGQSNMCFSTNQMTGAHDECALANATRFSSIRLFTAKPSRAATPQADLTVLQNWTAANSASVCGAGAFSHFSAVCWLQGRHLFDRLEGKVPLGLLTSAYGGTRIHSWSSSDALGHCPQKGGSGDDSNLWNKMISPILQMRFKFIVWLQSESDVCPSDTSCTPQRGAIYYSCAIKAMVTDWRAKLGYAAKSLAFLWVQISPWEGHEAATTSRALPNMRLGQMAANDLENVAMATAVDLGPPANANGWNSGDEHGPDPWGNVHFRNKGPLGSRLSAAAANLVYGNTVVPYRGPEAASVVVNANSKSTSLSVTVSFEAETVGGGLKWVAKECPYIVLKNEANFTTELDCKENIDDCIAKCGWWDMQTSDGVWHKNVTATISGDSQSVVLLMEASMDSEASVTAAAARYLYADWPVATLFNENGFPALPFVMNITAE